MTTMDMITEEIAHFVGLLQSTTEHARLREAYNEFWANNPVHPDPDPSPFIKAPFAAPYELLGYDPGIAYKSGGPDPFFIHPWPILPTGVPHLRTEPTAFAYPELPLSKPAFAAFHTNQAFILPQLEPPGSVVTYINQVIMLSDNDYFGVGGHGLTFMPEPVDNADLLAGAATASSLSPIGALDRPGSSAEIIEVIKTVAAQLDGFAADPDGAGPMFVHQAGAIEGIYVNGQLVDEAPKLKDYHSFDEDEEDGETDDGDAPTSNAWVLEDGSVIIKASVTLDAGSNTLVNDAVVKSFWTAATVTAVVGDHIELNAIVQINAIWDVDAIASSIGNWTDGAVNDIFNIATFERFDSLANDGPAQAEIGGFPQNWTITEVDGDLTIMNWLEQFIFMSDNDVGILSSSGVTTTVTSGDNLGANQTSIFELGFSYDLIIVGGSVYDANIIQQMNVLFDNDVVDGTPGFQTNGKGELSSSGNLLWNEAYIKTIGGADRFDTLPEDYLATAQGLGKGGHNISKGVLTDNAFEGLDTLRVLYIKGDLLNLQYIKQTSILGDSDQIALAMDALNPHLGGGWSISTGGNALINNAAIYDLDSFGKTYVGGEHYSQETLIQAELISSRPDHLGGQDPNALVNEAVLFLDDSMLESTHEAAPGVYIPSEHDGPSDGGLQTLVGH